MQQPRILNPFSFQDKQGPDDGDFRPSMVPMDVDLEVEGEEEVEYVDPKDSSALGSAPSSPPPGSSAKSPGPQSMPEGLEDLEDDSLEPQESQAVIVTAEKGSTLAKGSAPSMPPSLPSPKAGPAKRPAKG